MIFCSHYLRQGLKQLFPTSRHPYLVNRTPYGLPVPKLLHHTLTEEDIAGRTLVVVGDVHGCCDEFEELLEKCNGLDSSQTCLIVVGDLVNKGPKSAEVVRLAMQLGAYAVRGNHDEVSLFAWQKYNEGVEELPQSFDWMKQLNKEELEWLSELPFTLHIPSRQIIVSHAGLVPGVNINSQKLTDLLHMRDVEFDAKTLTYSGLRKPKELSEPWAEVWEGPEHIYFGHDAKRLLQKYDFATGLDTGCVYGGHLTAVFPEENNKIVQVKAHKVYRDTKEGNSS